MSDTVPDPLAAAVAAIRERGYRKRAGAQCARLSDAAAGDVPRLLAAVEAVLATHRKMTLYALSVRAHDSQDPPRVWCGHTYLETENSRHQIADDDSIVCLDKPEGDVCESCFEEGGEAVEWPCPTYLAVAAALLGQDGATDAS